MPAKTYIHNDREYYVGTNKPVWPYRIREIRNAISTELKQALNDDDSVIHTLKALDRLEQETRPSSDSNAAGKDRASVMALTLAAKLVQEIAGWAIDHQLGKAKKGLGLEPLVLGSDPEGLERVAALDVHDHEREGIVSGELNPIQTRRFLLNLLGPMASPLSIPNNVIEALEALDFGETLPVFMKAPTTKRSGLTEYRAKLGAIAFIEFENEKGVKKHISTQVVADEFLVTQASVNDWKVELRTALGAFEVDRFLGIARAFGRAAHAEVREKDGPPGVRDHLEDRFGRPALQRAAERYKARSRKALKKAAKTRG
jgi:hypothetical protein